MLNFLLRISNALHAIQAKYTAAFFGKALARMSRTKTSKIYPDGRDASKRRVAQECSPCSYISALIMHGLRAAKSCDSDPQPSVDVTGARNEKVL